MIGDASAFHQIFFEEAAEHLAAIETVLLRADGTSHSAEALNEVFRSAHSIKGSSAMLGFTEIAGITHLLESVLDILRNGDRPLSKQDVDVMLHAGDVLRMQLAFRQGTLGAAPDASGVEGELRGLMAGEGDSRPERHFTVRLGPLAGPVGDADLETMLSGLGGMGTLQVHEIVNVAGGEIRFDAALHVSEGELMSVLGLVVAQELIEVRGAGNPPASTALQQIDGEKTQATEQAPLVPGKDAGATGVADQEVELFSTPQELRERRKARHGRRLTDDAVTPAKPAEETERAQPGVPGEAASIRVNVEKIDRLVNLVGELVITENMLARQGEHLNTDSHRDALAGLSDLARNMRDLQEAVLSIRMVPISVVYARFPRLARELSQRLGKEVELKVSGEATELDRGLIEKVADPLMHLVRNAIDHGLETPEVRLAAGKPARGTLQLAASQRGGNILIEVRDDGRGLDRARILEHAAQRGVAIAQDAPDQDVWQLIFAPGFSTAETVTDVSGRGVGMDVVKRNIHLLGGSVKLASSPGQGTTVTVSVPLTLAIVEAMTVAVGRETYVLPLAAVVESRRVAPGEIHGIAGKGSTLRWRGDYLPVRRVGEILGVRGSETDSGDIAVIVEADGVRAAVLVDNLIGQQQVVVKNLETNFRKVPGISGATIMGDGRVAMILDVTHIVGRTRGSLEKAA